MALETQARIGCGPLARLECGPFKRKSSKLNVMSERRGRLSRLLLSLSKLGGTSHWWGKMALTRVSML